MASRTQFDKDVISVLKYDASYPYFAQLKFSKLYDAQRHMRRNEYYNESGSRDERVFVGKIDGNVICGALWRLMGYNPGRFTTNPFLHNGRNNIFRFVTNAPVVSPDATTANVVHTVRRKMREYLAANAKENGQWQDEIATTDGGYVYTVLKDGRTGPMYKKLCILRDAVKLITMQNCADFESKREPYRTGIIQAVQQRHPERFGISPAVNITADDDIAEDAIFEKIEQLQITLDNQSNVSSELYDQAMLEMARLKAELYEIRHRHIL